MNQPKAVAHGGGDHDVARADLIGDAAGEDARHGHDGLKDREGPCKSAGPLGVDGEQVLLTTEYSAMELMKNMVTHAAESTTARPLLELVEAIGLFLIDTGGGTGVSASPPCRVGLLVSRLGDAGLIGPELDTLVLKVVVGIGATAAGLGGEVAHHVGEAAVDLDGVAGGKVRALGRQEHDGVGDIADLADAARGDQAAAALFSTSGSA